MFRNIKITCFLIKNNVHYNPLHKGEIH